MKRSPLISKIIRLFGGMGAGLLVGGVTLGFFGGDIRTGLVVGTLSGLAVGVSLASRIGHTSDSAE